MPPPGEQQQQATAPSPASKRKRVGKACGYCRRKRLKCTTAQYPCANCQLYGAECVFSDEARPKRRNTAAARRSSPEATSPIPSRDVPIDRTVDVDDHALPQEHDRLDTIIDEPFRTHDDQRLQHDGFENLLNFWNPSVDLPGSILFEGLHTSPYSMTEACAPSFIPDSLVDLPLTRAYVSPRTHRNHGSGGRVSGIESLVCNDAQAAPTKRILPGLFIRKDPHDSNFIGLNSTGATLAFCIREPLHSNRGLSDSVGLDFLVEAGRHLDEAGVTRSVDIFQPNLPEKTFAQASIDLFFDNVHPNFPMGNEAKFRAAWERLYEPGRMQVDYLESSRFFLAVALGGLSSPLLGRSDATSESIFRDFYQHSWSIVQDCLASPNVSTVQVLLLHVLYHMHHGKGGFAWFLCGVAIRMAQAIGLHRRSPRDFDLQEDEIRLRSQIWWTAFRLDGFLSMTQGRPTSVCDSNFDVELMPLLAEKERQASGSGLSASEIYIWNSKLARIQHRFCYVTNRASTTVKRLDELGDVDAALLALCDDIPSQWRPGQDITADDPNRLLVASFHIEYFNALRAVHWASWICVHASRDGASAHRNPRIRCSEAICLSSARSLIRTFNDAVSDNGGGRTMPLCLQTDHLMAALAILYRSIFKNPQRISARADVEYFRAGKSHLERQMHASGLSPTLGRLFQAMLSSAESLVSDHIRM